MGKISDIAAYVNQNPSVHVGIDGSTDLLRGTNQYNEALSRRRVANVRDALIRAGVSANQIETGGFGGDGPGATALPSSARGATGESRYWPEDSWCE